MFNRLLLLPLIAALSLTGCNEDTAPKSEASKMESKDPLLPAASADATNDDAVPAVARLNGKPVSAKQFALFLREKGVDPVGLKDQTERYTGLLRELITMQLMAQDAVSLGLDQDPVFKEEMAYARTKALLQAALRYRLADAAPNDEALMADYDKMTAENEALEYKAAHILVKTEEEAKELIAKASAGEDFAELAKQHSTGPSGPRGGDLGWFADGRMVKPFSDAVKQMSKGDISSTPVKTQFGWHIIQLNDTRPAAVEAFDQFKLKQVAAAQREAATRYISDLMGKADVQIPNALVSRIQGAEAGTDAADNSEDQATPAPTPDTEEKMDGDNVN